MNPLSLQRGLRRLRDEALDRTGTNARGCARLDGSRAALLMYHRVLPEERAHALSVEPGMFVTPETFGRHLDWLAAEFQVMPLGEVVGRLAAGRPLPSRACAITFDDGWRDNHDYAWPELERRALPATIFVVTDRVGTLGAFWPDEVCRRLAPHPPEARRAIAQALGAPAGGDPALAILERLKRATHAVREQLLARLREAAPAPAEAERELLDWDEIDRMAAGGVAFESHGVSHSILPGLDGAQLDCELTRSRERLLERDLGQDAVFAYPSGAFDAAVRESARAAGYRAAVTTLRGLAEPAHAAMTLPRVGLHEDVSRSRAAFRGRICRAPVLSAAAAAQDQRA